MKSVRAKLTYLTLAGLLVFYFLLVGSRGVLLIEQGRPLLVIFGLAVLVLPLIGTWFLWHTTRFARNAGRLARELEAEGGLPVDELRRTPSGRIDRDSADEVFVKRKAEAESAPNDWRCWFRLAVAYHDARDTPQARRAMQRAISLHDNARRGDSSGAP
jgi:tetratricopeptide (TPR) repeat protein